MKQKQTAAERNRCHRFRRAVEKAGIHTPASCGPAVRDLLLSLRSSPLLLRTDLHGQHHRATPTDKPAISKAIAAGFAKFIPDEKLYAITPAGETWLQELEIHGIEKEASQ